MALEKLRLEFILDRYLLLFRDLPFTSHDVRDFRRLCKDFGWRHLAKTNVKDEKGLEQTLTEIRTKIEALQEPTGDCENLLDTCTENEAKGLDGHFEVLYQLMTDLEKELVKEEEIDARVVFQMLAILHPPRFYWRSLLSHIYWKICEQVKIALFPLPGPWSFEELRRDMRILSFVALGGQQDACSPLSRALRDLYVMFPSRKLQDNPEVWFFNRAVFRARQALRASFQDWTELKKSEDTKYRQFCLFSVVQGAKDAVETIELLRSEWYEVGGQHKMIGDCIGKLIQLFDTVVRKMPVNLSRPCPCRTLAKILDRLKTFENAFSEYLVFRHLR